MGKSVVAKNFLIGYDRSAFQLLLASPPHTHSVLVRRVPADDAIDDPLNVTVTSHGLITRDGGWRSG